MWSRRLDPRKAWSKTWVYRRSDSTSVSPSRAGHALLTAWPGFAWCSRTTRIKVFRPDPLGQPSVESRRFDASRQPPAASECLHSLIRRIRQCVSRLRPIISRLRYLLILRSARVGMMSGWGSESGAGSEHWAVEVWAWKTSSSIRT